MGGAGALKCGKCAENAELVCPLADNDDVLWCAAAVVILVTGVGAVGVER